MINKRRSGLVQYTNASMKKILGLPEECTLRHVVSDYNSNGTITIVVESPYLNEVEEGAQLPFVTLSQITGYDE